MTHTAKFIAEALERKDPAWVFFYRMTDFDRSTMDREICEANHPLAFKKGTKRFRFFTLCREAGL